MLFAPPALAAPAPNTPRPLPFALQASKAYGDPDRAEDRPFDRYVFPGADGKPNPREGRYFMRQWHYRKDSGEEKPSTYQVYLNVKNALEAAGAKILKADGNSVVVARGETGGHPLWIRVDAGSDYWTLYCIEELPFHQEFSADFLQASFQRDGFVALDVRFATDSDQVLPESLPLLDRAAAMLKAHPEWKVGVEGHTDATGDAARNRELSVRRARSVLAALAQRGVAAGSLTAAGFGPDRPVADNRTEEGRARNRRVELVKN